MQLPPTCKVAFQRACNKTGAGKAFGVLSKPANKQVKNQVADSEARIGTIHQYTNYSKTINQEKPISLAKKILRTLV